MEEENPVPGQAAGPEMTIEAPAQVPEQSKTPRSNKNLLLIVLAVVLLLGVGGWLLMQSRNKDKKQAPAPVTSITPVTYPLTTDVSDRLSFATESTEGTELMFYYAPSKRNVNVAADKSLTSKYTTSQKSLSKPVTAAELLKSLQDKITSEGFALYHETGVYLDKFEVENKISRYKKGTIVCVVSVNGNEEVDSHFIFYHTCTDSAGLEAAAKSIEPFYMAYENSKTYKSLPPEARDDKNAAYSLSIPNIKASDFAGYEYASSGLGGFDGGAGAKFYRKIGGDWQFAYAAQSMFDCTLFDNADMRKALSHEGCAEPAVPGKDAVFTTVKAYFKL